MGASNSGARRDRGPWQSRRPATSASPGRNAVGAAVTALRQGREAIVEIDGHLDDILGYLHNPRRGLSAELPGRLASSARRAGEALAALGGPAGSELF